MPSYFEIRDKSMLWILLCIGFSKSTIKFPRLGEVVEQSTFHVSKKKEVIC
jgi:hypothetical protein